MTAPVVCGRLYVSPVIGALLVRHEGLTTRMMLLDRNVQIVEEGIDVAVRIERLAHSALRVVGIGSVQQTIVASLACLAEHGVSATPADLVGYACLTGSRVPMGTISTFGDRRNTLVEIAPRLTVSTIDAAIAAAEAGLGLGKLLSYPVGQLDSSGPACTCSGRPWGWAWIAVTADLRGTQTALWNLPR